VTSRHLAPTPSPDVLIPGLRPPRIDTDERYTPTWIFDALGESFDLDPAHPDHPTAVPTAAYLTRADDGLTSPWHGFVWCNPPYSNTTPWARRWLAHGQGLLLVPIANAHWAQEVFAAADRVWLLRSFPFDHPTHAGKRANMPVMLVGLGARAAAAIDRAAARQPDAGVVVVRAAVASC
jgi:hypothetical protein